MANKTHEYTPDTLHTLEKKLLSAAMRLKSVRENMEHEEVPSLFIFNRTSGERGVDAALSFSKHAEDSWEQFEFGTPYAADSTKSNSHRSVKKKPNKKRRK